MKLKQLAIWLLCLLMLAALPTAASAQRPESMDTLTKTYILNISETQGSIEAQPMTPAFWEYPVLRAGEQYAQGTMIIRNSSSYTAAMELTDVTLPYGDEAKLSYLDHLQLTVCKGDQVIYDNTYAHINDEEGGLKIALDAIAPGEEHTYSIRMRCRYDYAGDPTADVSQVAWLFSASTITTTYEEPEGLPDWAKMTVIIFAVMMVVLIAIMIVRAVISAKKKKQPIDK